MDKTTRDRFALLDFDIPPAKAPTASPPAPDPPAIEQRAAIVNALYGYATVYPELAARIISDPPAPDDAGLTPLDRLRYLLAGRTPPK